MRSSLTEFKCVNKYYFSRNHLSLSRQGKLIIFYCETMSVVWSHLCCRHSWLAEQNADFIVWHVFNVQRNWSRPDLDQLVCTSPADRTRHILSRSFLAPPVLVVHPFPSPHRRAGLLFVYWHHFIETYCRARDAWLLILWFIQPLSSGVVTNGLPSVSVGLRSR